MSPRRILAVAQKEWREIVRDRLFFALAFVVPVFLMLLLGFGLTLDVEQLPLVIVDQDGSALSREYAHRFAGSRYFDFRGYARDARVVDRMLTAGEVRAGLVIPEHFGRDLLAGRPARVQTLIDGSLPYRALVVKGYAVAIDAAMSAELAAAQLERARGLAPAAAERSLRPVRLEVRYLYNQSARSAWSLGPKLLMMILFMSSPFLTALGVVREKETGAIYNVYASTVSRSEFLIGKLTPYAVISLANALVLWAMATTLFGAPFKGDPLLLAAATLLYVLCCTGIGLLVSVLVRTQTAAMLATAILTMIPAQLYSGAIIPMESLSPSGQLVTRALPAIYYHDVVVGTFLKGAGPGVLWPRLVVLGAYAVALRVAGLVLFHKRPRA